VRPAPPKEEVWLVKNGHERLVQVSMTTPTVMRLGPGGEPEVYRFNGKRDQFGVRFYDYEGRYRP